MLWSFVRLCLCFGVFVSVFRANVGLSYVCVCMCMCVCLCACGPLLEAAVQPKSMRGRYSRTMGYV